MDNPIIDSKLDFKWIDIVLDKVNHQKEGHRTKGEN